MFYYYGFDVNMTGNYASWFEEYGVYYDYGMGYNFSTSWC